MKVVLVFKTFCQCSRYKHCDSCFEYSWYSCVCCYKHYTYKNLSLENGMKMTWIKADILYEW